eukprot:c9998_g1_i1.p1 GENE.c9998_g1_i1~~c9998_g1_i1.p1  ORF type:complete len:525 (-),score=221.72 c9998_g1_i1:117-1541(-)
MILAGGNPSIYDEGDDNSNNKGKNITEFSSFIELGMSQEKFMGFENMNKEYGIEKGDLLSVYSKINSMGLQKNGGLPTQSNGAINIDDQGKISGFDLHFLDPVRDLLRDRDLAADPKGYWRRIAAKKQRKKMRIKMYLKENHGIDWNVSSDEEEEERREAEEQGYADKETTPLSASEITKHESDIRQAIKTETVVMRSFCYHGIGRDIRDHLSIKVKLHVGTEFLDLLSGFISPIISPLLNSAFGVFIRLIGNAMTDAMADCLTFRMVGAFAPTIDGMLSKMMVPSISMGIIMILPQALVKVLATKFEVMLGAPLAQAVVKAVQKYRSQVSTPMLYHTISHSLSHSIESVLSNSLVHTVTNTVGSSLAHSLSHSLPAYYSCMRCYHNKVLGVLRPSPGAVDDCALCYNGNSIRTQERKEYAQQRKVGYRTSNGNTPTHPPLANSQGYISSLLGSNPNQQTFEQRAAQHVFQDAS